MANCRCPKCGSYNTGTAYLNYAGRGITNVLRGTLAAAGALALEAIRPHSPAGHLAFEKIWEETDPGEMKKNKCNNCGHQW